jgi:serine/threonine protein phosphatase PrpC
VGQTTAVVVVLRADRVFGASVGDSGAWWITTEGLDDLTEPQHRKPLLGSGMAQPVGFDRRVGDGTLLVATDGLLKYSSPANICTTARGPLLSDAVDQLLSSVRLRSGTFPDDVALALARRRVSRTSPRG